MAHGEVTEIISAPSHLVFNLLHDYGRRLESNENGRARLTIARPSIYAVIELITASQLHCCHLKKKGAILIRE
jgi:hypothetical protein